MRTVQIPISGPYTGVVPFPLPPQPDFRAGRLLDGLARLERLQLDIAAKLVDLLDEAEGDPDLEEEPDMEPSTGDPTCVRKIGRGRRRMVVDIDDDEHNGGEPSADDEYPLGWSEGEILTGQTGYSADDREPSLGSLEVTDQRQWADGGAAAWVHRDWDCEVQCEDEGVDADREPDEGGTVPTYADSGHDQTRIVTGHFGGEDVCTRVE